MTTPSTTASPLSRDVCIAAQWSAPPQVHAWVTTRRGGVSAAPYDSLNLGLHTGDARDAVLSNRERLTAFADEARMAWLEQVHGNTVVDAKHVADALDAGEAPARADASVTDEPGIACIVMVADCMPVLFCDERGRAVGAAHAGWRGLAAGVLERTAQAVAHKAGIGARVHAFLGPAIGPNAFEVGHDVLDAFIDAAPPNERDATHAAFVPHGPGKLLASLPTLARLRLARAGVVTMTGGDLCTVCDTQRFFSYRRDHTTGRFAGVIWLGAH